MMGIIQNWYTHSHAHEYFKMSDFRSPAKNVIAQNLDIEDAYDILQVLDVC